MTREEFAAVMNYPLESLPADKYLIGTSWEEIYNNSCPECKSFNTGGYPPALHLINCPNYDKGFKETTRRILRDRG